MPRADARFWSDSSYRNRLYDLVDRGVGGIAVFLGDIETTAAMIADLQKKAKGSLLIAADYEYGLPMRLEGGIAFPRAMALGHTLPGITEHVAACIAQEARAIGVHWNFAPVCDVNSNPSNPIINTRSFGEDPAIVAAHAVAYVHGTQRHAVLACGKHVPGHGDTDVDSHVSLPTITATADLAAAREFVPFRAVVDAGVETLMIGHMLVPFLDPSLPASLSRSVVTDLVRKEWGFDGLVTTDALDMKAIASTWTSAEAAVASVLAGNDVVLLPEDPVEAIKALVAAVENGTISEERLTVSERRWQRAREFAGIGKPPSVPIVIDQSSHAVIALQAAQGAMRIAGDVDLLPITKHDQYAAFAVIDETDADAATTWFHYLAKATEGNSDFGYLDDSIDDADLDVLRNGIADADVVVFAFFGKAVAYRGHMSGIDRLPAIMRRLAGDKPIIIVVCGSPYGMENLPHSLILHMYSDTVPSLAASVLRLTGRETPSGTQS